MNSRTELRRRLCATVFFAFCAISAQARATKCDDGFREMRAADGGRLFVTIVPYASVDAHRVLADFTQLATRRGYMVIAPADFSKTVATLGIAKPPAPGPILVTADPSTSLISVTSMVPAGSPADPAHERSVVCGLLAAYDASLGSGSGPATPAASRRDDYEDSSRTTLPTAVPTLNLIEPKAKFEMEAARDALRPGSSVIRGQACGGVKTGAVAYASSVALFPATPYLEELLRLEKSAKPGRDQVVPDPDALSIRMVAKADAEGRFQFSKMKPGRYYLTTTISGLFGGTRDVQIGRVTDAYGSADVYAKQDYTFDASKTIGKFVTVGRDGDVIDVTLQPPITANPFHRGLSGSILGCRRLP